MGVRKVVVDYLIKVKTDAAEGKGAWGAIAAESKAAATGVGAAAAGFAAAGYAAVSLANDLTDTIDAIQTLSATTGLSESTVKALGLVAAATGKDIDKLVPPDLAKRISEVRAGTGEAVKGFEALGLAARIQSGELSSADDVLRATVDALGAVEDPTLRASLAMQTLGESARELTHALSSTEQLDAYAAFAESFGTDTGPRAAAATSEWQRATAMLSTSADGLMSSFIWVVEWLTLMTDGVGLFLATMAGGFSAVADSFEGVGVAGFANLKNFIAGASDALDEYQKKYIDIRMSMAEDADEGIPVYGPPIEGAGSKGGGDSGGGAGPDKAAAAAAARARADEAARVLYLGLNTAIVDGASVWVPALMGDLATQTEDAFGDLEAAMAGVIDKLNKAAADARPDEARAGPSGKSDLGGAAEAMAAPLGAAMGAVLGGPLTAIAQAVMGLPDVMRGLQRTVEELPQTLLDIPTILVGLLDSIGDLPLALAAKFPEIAVALAGSIFKVFTWGFESFANILAELFDLLPGRIASEIADALRGLFDNLNPFDGDGELLWGAAGKVKDAIPFFETGGDVSSTGLAVLHEGERVITANERASLMRGAGGGAIVNVATPDPMAAARAVARAIGPQGRRQRIVGGF